MLAIASTRRHLYIVCTDPFVNQNLENCVVIVNVSSCQRGLEFDDSCILTSGIHKFIHHKSYVRYRDARIESVSSIQKGIEAGKISVLKSISPKTLKRVLKGFEQSEFTPVEVLERLQSM